MLDMLPRYGLPEVLPEKVGMSSKGLSLIKPAMQQFIDRHQAAGFITAIARRGRIVHFETQGYADIEKSTPLTTDSIFRIYSMTKPITAVAVMMLYDDGRFLLNDPVATYLPEFNEMKVYSGGELVDAERPITIMQLLTHTAGLDYGFYSGDPVASQFREHGLNDADARTSGLSTSAYVKKLSSMPLYAQPGVLWRYSDGMSVLGRLVEVISGESYKSFLSRRLFDPLSMVDTDFFVPKEKSDRLAQLYELNSNGVIANINTQTTDGYGARTIRGSDYREKPSFESGGAGLVSTAADYLRFSQMLLNCGELDDTRILSTESARMIMTNHLNPMFGERPLNSLDNQITSGKGLGFGFCGLVVADAQQCGWGSNGLYSWGGAASTFFWIDSSQDLIGLVLTQLLPDNVYPSSQKMLEMTYEAISRE